MKTGTLLQYAVNCVNNKQDGWAIPESWYKSTEKVTFDTRTGQSWKASGPQSSTAVMPIWPVHPWTIHKVQQLHVHKGDLTAPTRKQSIIHTHAHNGYSYLTCDYTHNKTHGSTQKLGDIHICTNLSFSTM